MTLNERLQKALRASNPGQNLGQTTLELFHEGRSQEEIYNLLEEFLLRLRTRADYRGSDEEALLDTLDALTGWCHPEARLLPGNSTSTSP